MGEPAGGKPAETHGKGGAFARIAIEEEMEAVPPMRARVGSREPLYMPRYLIERSFLHRIELAVNEVIQRNADDGVTWLHTYVSEDCTKAFDVYDSPTPEAIRRTASRNGLPVDAITEVRILERTPTKTRAGGEVMATSDYAKRVLVDTEWLLEHLNDDDFVVAEVDESPEKGERRCG